LTVASNTFDTLSIPSLGCSSRQEYSREPHSSNDGYSLYYDGSSGFINITNNTELAVVNLPPLQRLAGLSFSNNPKLTAVSFTTLTEVESLEITNNSALITMDFSNLAQTGSYEGGSLVIEDNSPLLNEVSFPMLELTYGDVFMRGNFTK
jgi:hypothetical protein